MCGASLRAAASSSAPFTPASAGDHASNAALTFGSLTSLISHSSASALTAMSWWFCTASVTPCFAASFEASFRPCTTTPHCTSNGTPGRSDARLLDAGGEVRIRPDARERQPQLRDARLELLPRRLVVVERRDVRAL